MFPVSYLGSRRKPRVVVKHCVLDVCFTVYRRESVRYHSDLNNQNWTVG